MRNTKRKTKPEAADEEMPAELDPIQLRFIGFGLDALERHVAAKQSGRTVALAADVAKEFKTEEEVNEALRLVKQLRDIGVSRQRKKTA